MDVERQGSGNDPGDPKKMERAIGALISLDADDQLAVLGNAFVVRAADDRALCFSARHSLTL